MNAVATTYRAVADLLRKATTPAPCIGDVVMWAAEQPDRPYRNFGYAAQLITGATIFTPLSQFKADLDRALEMELSRQKQGHWSKDINRLIAVKQMKAHVERYEKETK